MFGACRREPPLALRAERIPGNLAHFSSEPTVTWTTARRVLSAWPRELALQIPALTRIFVNLALDAGDGFPRAVQDILPFVQPAETPDLFMLWMPGLRGDEPGFSRRLPEPGLALTNAVVGERVGDQQAGDLSAILRDLAEVAPDLTQDARYLRLGALLPG